MPVLGIHVEIHVLKKLFNPKYNSQQVPVKAVHYNITLYKYDHDVWVCGCVGVCGVGGVWVGNLI